MANQTQATNTVTNDENVELQIDEDGNLILPEGMEFPQLEPLMYPIEETADAYQVVICPCTTEKIEDFRSGVKFGLCQGMVGRIIYPKSKYDRERVEDIVRNELTECTQCEQTNTSCQNILSNEKKDEVMLLIGGNIIGMTVPIVLDRIVDQRYELPVRTADVVSYGGGLLSGILAFLGDRLNLSARTQRMLATVGIVLVTSRGVKQIADFG